MDDDDFEELLCEGELLHGSSPESVMGAAADLLFEEGRDASPYNASRTVEEHVDVPDSDRPPQVPATEIEAATVSSDTGIGHDLKPYPNASVIDKIEEVFEQIADAMLNEKNEFSITLKTRRRASRNQRRDRDEDYTKRLCFPGKTANEAWRFAVVIRILELMHEALRNDVVMSKRDIYYRDSALFGSQSHVDRYIDDIALTFGITRTALNVTAASKGLLAGAITFCRRDGSTFTAAQEPDGLLIPALKEILSVDMSAVQWILVIEKEATFRSIAASSFWSRISTEGVIITGKGYPDLASRALLRFLSTASPQNGFASPPVYGLADFDPDGVAILSTYKHGSKALAHENEAHRVPQLKWLGLRSQNLLLGGNNSQAIQGVMTLSPRDRRKAIRLVEQQNTTEDGIDADWAAELRRMLMLNMKAELQLIDAVPGGMVKLLESTLHGAGHTDGQAESG